MVLIRTNVLVNTARARHNSTHGTGAPIPYLEQVPGFIYVITINDYHSLPQAALQSEYRLKVDKGTDINTGDIITDIFYPNGVTPWLGYNFTTEQEYLAVSLALDTSPGFLECREIYIQRNTIGGPSR